MPRPITVSSKLINDAIARGPAALLKSEGFRKRGRHFFRQSRDGTAHVSFQAGQWNAPDSARFTINLWSYLPAIAEAGGQVPILDPMKQLPAHAGARIGHLMPKQTDYWWNITAPTEVDSVSRQVVEALRDYGFPYLFRIASLEGVAELSGCIPGIANDPTEPKVLALQLLGRTTEADAVREETRIRAEKFRSRRANATEA